jgi:lipopolysaccharide export LptBFGC system permease protein LptF
MIPLRQNIELHGIEIVSSPKAIYSGESAPIHIFADRGRYENGAWILEKPSVFTYSLDGKHVSLARPQWFSLYVPVDPQAFQSGFLLQLPMWSLARSATQTFAQLGADLKRDRSQGINDVQTLLDYHFKLSIPFSCLVMALCCPPLALRFAKGGGFMGTLLSICLVFVYWNTLLLTRILGSPGPDNSAPLLVPQIAAWSQNVLFVLLGLFVLKKSE